MDKIIKVIRQAKVYDPEFLGTKDLLILGDKIAAIEDEIKIDIPSSSIPLALASRADRSLASPSVPSVPTTVVTPAFVNVDRVISGVLVLKPPSPPPPRM